MVTLSRRSSIFAALLLSTFAVAADNTALRSLVEAEKSFAATSAERGIRESFLQFFAENSIIFAPEPKNGKKFYTYYEDKGRKLTWRPIFATIAQSGELGVSAGPWELAKSKTETTPIAFGDFLSIWRKQPDNSWKVIVDVGVDHNQPGDLPAEPQLLSANEGRAKADVDLARRALQQTERKLGEAMQASGASAIAAVASEYIRVLRQNALPTVGRDAATALLANDRRSMTRTFIDGGMAEAADLAYRYGSYSSQDKNVTARGYYLTIWRMESRGDWKVLVDLQKETAEKP
jgi:ketosteroid isomerase-like protein